MAYTTAQIEAMKQIGKFWQSEDGSKRRIYFTATVDILDMKVSFYNSGAVSSATIGGEKISNSSAKEYLFKLSRGKVYLDVTTGELVFSSEFVYPNKFRRWLDAQIAEVAA